MRAIDWLRDVIADEPVSAAYKFGKNARAVGAKRQDNPYESGTDHAQWLKGWEAADELMRERIK